MDDRGVEADSRVEQEPATVRDTEPDAAERSAPERREELRRRAGGRARDPERAAVHVRRSGRKGSERGFREREAVGGFVERAVTGEHCDDIGTPLCRLTRELGRVPPTVGLHDVDRVLDPQYLARRLAIARRDL